MSWQDLLPHKPKALVAAPVRVGVRQMREAPARAIVLIKAEVLNLLPGGRYRISIGSGEQKHQLRIAADEVGPFEATEMGKAKGGGMFRFILPPLDRFPECKVDPQACDHVFVKAEKALLIDLPAWGWNEKIKLDVERQAGVR